MIEYNGVTLEQHNDSYMIYRGIVIEEYNGRFVVVTNKDLLKLNMCTVKSLQRGHKGYFSLEFLAKRIDRELDSE